MNNYVLYKNLVCFFMADPNPLIMNHLKLCLFSAKERFILGFYLEHKDNRCFFLLLLNIHHENPHTLLDLQLQMVTTVEGWGLFTPTHLTELNQIIIIDTTSWWAYAVNLIISTGKYKRK